jgi:hypothetical protein
MANWTDLSGVFTFGSKLTSTQQSQLRDNITAAFEGAAGAPTLANSYITDAMLQLNIVDNANLRTTVTGSGSFSVSSSTPWVPSSGYYLWAANSTAFAVNFPKLEMKVGASWSTGTPEGQSGGLLITDGVNFRLRGATVGVVINWRQF